MRKLIAGMKISLDGKVEGADGIADWVEGWSEDYGLTPQIDACLLGAGMYTGYEGYWTAIQNAPDKPHPMTGTLPTPAEVEWAKFAARAPHYVLSSKLKETNWSNTNFVRSLDEIVALKKNAGKNIFLVGGAKTAASLIDAELVDEFRLIVYPLIAGAGKELFAAAERRHRLELRKAEPLPDGKVGLTYGIV
jgi:dihydrofolate reductase